MSYDLCLSSMWIICQPLLVIWILRWMFRNFICKRVTSGVTLPLFTALWQLQNYPCNIVGLKGFYTPINLYFLDKAVLWFHVQISLIHWFAGIGFLKISWMCVWTYTCVIWCFGRMWHVCCHFLFLTWNLLEGVKWVLYCLF